MSKSTKSPLQGMQYIDFYTTDSQTLFEDMQNYQTNFQSDYSQLITTQINRHYYAVPVYHLPHDNRMAFGSLWGALQNFHHEFYEHVLPTFNQWQVYQNFRHLHTFKRTVILFNQYLKNTCPKYFNDGYFQIDLGDQLSLTTENFVGVNFYDNQHQRIVNGQMSLNTPYQMQNGQVHWHPSAYLHPMIRPLSLILPPNNDQIIQPIISSMLHFYTHEIDNQAGQTHDM